ncbi:MAG: peptidylprolyl isomerase [Desulfococcaceae bacterium]
MYRRIAGLVAMAAVLTMLVPMAWSASEGGSEDRVAVVNGEPISRAALEREMTPVRHQMGMTGDDADEAKLDEIRKQVLDNLIRRELVFQESKKKGFTVEDSAVQERLEALKSRFPNPEQFQAMMEQMSFTEEILKRQIREQLTIQKFVESQIVENIEVAEAEAKEYYEENQERFKQPEQVHARHILIKVDEGADESAKAEAKGRLEDVQKKLEEGGDFAKLAEEFSEDPSKSRGGDLGFFGRGQMVKPFEEAVFALEPGEVSGIVETQFGYHLIELVEEKAAGAQTFADARPQIEQMLKNRRIKSELDQYIENLREAAEIEILI